jgi:16S rRNA (adenine1518-N6/adenine1519-N6)-dimethyltransferase
MAAIRAKKSLGQHFLKDKSIARRIAGLLTSDGYDSVLEIGPGMGVLTQYLIERDFRNFKVIELDFESVEYLKNGYPGLCIIKGDFLKMDLKGEFEGKIAVIGNFPYNISSQIVFRVIENREMVVELAGMFQREVAERICAVPGSKKYGILSVLTSAFYTTKYIFTVSENVFSPPPRVKSGVITLRRNQTGTLGCNEELFFRVVKASFNQRRKMLRNSVKAAFTLKSYDYTGLHLRPEQLSVEAFVNLTNWVEENLIS